MKRPGDTHFDPIWARLQDADIPGCLHVIVRFEGAAAAFSEWNQAGAGLVFGFGLGATGQLIPAMASLVLDGVCERFPRLKIVSVEAGCGYAAYLMDRLDEKHHFFRAMSPLQMRPSDYIRRNCYFVAEPEERTVGAMLELVGEDNILWGSDYPPRRLATRRGAVDPPVRGGARRGAETARARRERFAGVRDSGRVVGATLVVARVEPAQALGDGTGQARPLYG